MKIAICYGTETGNAEMLADDIQSHLSDHETTISPIFPMWSPTVSIPQRCI